MKLNFEQAKARVAKLVTLPGWQVTECMLVSMSTLQSSDSIITAMRDSHPLTKALRSISPTDREGKNAVRRAWRDETIKQAELIQSMLAVNQFTTRSQYGQIYVTDWTAQQEQEAA